MRKLALAACVLSLSAIVGVGCSDGVDSTKSEEASVGVEQANLQKATPEVLDSTTSHERTRVIVTLQSNDAKSVLSKVASLGNTVRVTRTWKYVPGFAADLDQAGLKALLADPNVAHVQVDEPVHTNLTESTALIQSKAANDSGYKGTGQKVAVVDTGVARNHATLSGKVVDEACFCAGGCPNGADTQTGEGSSADDQGHGSHVAGIVLGVAPEAKIIGVKVLNADGSGSTSDIISGLEWILDNHPDAVAVNMSLGSSTRSSSDCDSSNSSYATAIDNLRAKGVLTVVASGNNGSSTGISVPSCIKNSFSVGAVYDANVGSKSWSSCTDSSTAADKIACFSNSAANLDILAPGSVITSVNYTGGTTNMSGTSQATPHVAGAAAVLRAANTKLAPADLEDILKSTGVAITDSRNSVTKNRINVDAAAKEAVRRGQSQ